MMLCKFAVDIIFDMNKEDFPRLSSGSVLLTACSQQHIKPSFCQTAFLDFDEGQYAHLLKLAHQHGIYPLLYKSLQTIKPMSFSEALYSHFKKSNMRIAQRNMLMSAELLQLMQLFSQNGVDAMAFKGPVLSEKAYGNVTLRQYGDLDILIKKRDIQKALALLSERAYVPEIDLDVQTSETFYRCVNVIGLQKGAVRVEIHWELLSKNYAIDWDESGLWAQDETVLINDQPVRTLSFANHLLYLCAHGSKHLFERLEWVCDIDRMVRIEDDLDYDDLLTQARALGIERMLFLGLALSRYFFKLPLPQDLIYKIEADREIDPLIKKVISIHYSEQKQEKSYSTFWLLWQMREKLSDCLRFAYRGLFAPKFDDFKFIQLPAQLSFLYPLIRPYRLITKYFRK